MVQRSNKGSILIFIILLIGVFLPVCAVYSVFLLQINLMKYRHDNAVEAASLAAAHDLGRIVIRDPYFGYVALTDHPPVGRATLAPDGEPLPVHGINTIWATCRQEILLAQLLNNDVLEEKALAEVAQARRSTRLLMDTLSASLSETTRQKFFDLNGGEVTPYKDAHKVLRETGFGHQMTPLKLTLGWSSSCSDSGTTHAQPFDMARISKSQVFGNNYRAFTNIPAGGQDFYFAALGPQTGLVSAKAFQPADGKRLCSIVRAECDLLYDKNARLHGVACAQPQYNPDTTNPGILRIAFDDGLIPQISCMRDLLNHPVLAHGKADILTALGGDYPSDPHAALLLRDQTERDQSLTSVVALGLFDWLRSTKNKARLDSILETIDTPFASIKAGMQPKPLFTYEVGADGNIIATNHGANQFLEDYVSENQKCARCTDAYTANGAHWTMYFRDQVRELGTQGGKHAGESMVANCVNWCDLPFYGGSEESAESKLKGKARGITVIGESENFRQDNGISSTAAQFADLAGSILHSQPRKTYYSGGLAVEIRFLLASRGTEESSAE